MDTLSDFHPGIQYAIRRLLNPSLTFEELGRERGITKQAVQKQFSQAVEYLRGYQTPSPTAEMKPCPDCAQRDGLIKTLRRQLVVASVIIRSLRFFKEQVLKIFPRFKISRLPPQEKKAILDALEKYKANGGLIKDFAKAIGRSPATLAAWQKAYDKYGLSGLADKSTRPKNFGNRVPLWIKKHLVALFLQFPRWTPYQYHNYIRHNPATHWYVSLPVIAKLKEMHQEKSEAEKERIRKRWAFAPGTRAWTADFTSILKTPAFKLQLLTVSDQRSRYLLHSTLYLNTSSDIVARDLEDLFIKFGRPGFVKADNGPEFRIELREHLRNLAVYLFNSPDYYGQFNGAHERIHRTLKGFIDDFESHQNLSKLVVQIQEFVDQYNYKMPMDSLGGKTPADIFLNTDETFTPDGAEIVTPYEKDGELRMKFTNREGHPARVAMPIIDKSAP
jgi:transposase InsO family protein